MRIFPVSVPLAGNKVNPSNDEATLCPIDSMATELPVVAAANPTSDVMTVTSARKGLIISVDIGVVVVSTAAILPEV